MNPTVTQTNSNVMVDDTQAPNTSEVDAQLNENQQNTQEVLDNRDPEVIKLEEGIQQEMDEEIGDFVPVDVPDFSDMYLKLRTKYGLDQLDQGLIDIKNDYRKLEAFARERRNVAMGQRVGMDVIGGRVGEIERQASEQLDTLGRQAQYLADMQRTSMQMVQQIMELEQLDYQNAVNSYQAEFDARMSMYQLKKEIAFEERSLQLEEQKFLADQANANLSLITQWVANGTFNPATMSAEMKAMISKLEVQAGIPVGTIAKMRIPPGARIITTGSYINSEGRQVTTITRYDDNGKIVTDEKVGGYVQRSSSGTSSGTAGERQSAAESNFTAKITTRGSAEREYAIKMVQQFGKSKAAGHYYPTTKKKTHNSISASGVDSAAAMIASRFGVSEAAAYAAVEVILDDHHYSVT